MNEFSSEIHYTRQLLQQNIQRSRKVKLANKVFSGCDGLHESVSLGFFSPLITFRLLHKVFSLEKRKIQRNFIMTILPFRGPRREILSGFVAIEKGVVILN